MDDATVAVEVAACEALVQWPYLSDMTLIWALASIFLLPPPIGAHSHIHTLALPRAVVARAATHLTASSSCRSQISHHCHVCQRLAVVQACRSRQE